MPSSTSSSSVIAPVASRIDRFTIALLGMVVLFLMLVEGISRVGFDSISKVQRREVAQRRAVLAVDDAADVSDPHIALFGNSLMLEGTDVSQLSSSLEPSYSPIQYFVLGTNYYDWLYGLKRLFAQGMHPRYVLVGLSPNQLATSEIRGDISARYLIQQSDLLPLVRATHMDATRASEIILAHYSEFYGTRDITRGFIMSRILPGVGELLHSRLAVFRDSDIPESQLMPLAEARLAQLDRLCQANGAHLIFVVPPTYQKGSKTIAKAGRQVGVTVLVPVGDGEFDSSYYQSDGFHLNEKGAALFTGRLALALKDELPK
jgi:hypothetical protein